MPLKLEPLAVSVHYTSLILRSQPEANYESVLTQVNSAVLHFLPELCGHLESFVFLVHAGKDDLQREVRSLQAFKRRLTVLAVDLDPLKELLRVAADLRAATQRDVQLDELPVLAVLLDAFEELDVLVRLPPPDVSVFLRDRAGVTLAEGGYRLVQVVHCFI